jgi:hypothetical protein
MPLADADLPSDHTAYLLANVHIIIESCMSRTGTKACHHTSDEPALLVAVVLSNINFVKFKVLTAVTIKLCPNFYRGLSCPIRQNITNVCAKLSVLNLR